MAEGTQHLTTTRETAVWRPQRRQGRRFNNGGAAEVVVALTEDGRQRRPIKTITGDNNDGNEQTNKRTNE